MVANSGSMKLPLIRLNEFQSMRRVSLRGRLASRKARALSGSEKVDLTNLSWGWWRGLSGMFGESWEQHVALQRVECDDFDHIEVPGGFCGGVSMSAGGGLTKSWIAKSFFILSGALPRGACSGGTVESRKQARLTCARNVAEFLQGRPPLNQMNLPAVS